MLLVNPTQNNDHVAIDMCVVVQVTSHDMTQDSWLQLWLSIAWIIWAWACNSVQQATRWLGRHAGTFWWLVPTRISLYLVPFLVTWQPREALRGFGQQRLRPQQPASRTPQSWQTHIPT